MGVFALIYMGLQCSCVNLIDMPDVLLQVPAWFGAAHDSRAALAGSILCFVALCVYCGYHVSPRRYCSAVAWSMHA